MILWHWTYIKLYYFAARHNSHIHYNSMMRIVIIQIHIINVVKSSKPTKTLVLAVTLTGLNYQKETFKNDFNNSLI